MRMLAFATTLITAGLLAGCGNEQPSASANNSDDAGKLTVLAGSELKDIEPLLPEIAKATGIKLKLQYTGTLDAIDSLQSGAKYDFAWLASNKYAMLNPAAKARILASEKTMLTPVVLGVKTSKAKELGWDSNDKLTWADISKAAGQGRFKFGMTNPTSSNTGFSAVLGLAAALANKGDALEEADIDKAGLTAFAKAQSLTSGSSGWLADAYVKDQDRIDGLINYASVLHRLNQETQLKEKLVLIYPRDGVTTADYPFMLLEAGKRAEYEKLVAYLKSDAFQTEMSRTTYRQPIVASAKSSVPVKEFFELPFPAKLSVVDKILEGFVNEFRRPADSTFVVDVSGSMRGERIRNLKGALTGLAGADNSLSGRFSKFNAREHIEILPFSAEPYPAAAWDIATTGSDNTATMKAIIDFANGLTPEGGTNIYSSVQKAYQAALVRQAKAPEKIYTIVLMTDGENNAGLNSSEFKDWFNSQPEAQRNIRIFPILFGEAKQDQLQVLAEVSGGRVFDAKKTGLQAVFKEIRGYQ